MTETHRTTDDAGPPSSNDVPLPVLVFDGDCGFCTVSARWGQEKLGLPNVEPWHAIELDRYGLTPEACQTAVQWVREDGSVASGHLAVAAALSEGNRWHRTAGRLMQLPGISQLSALTYRIVAKNRHRLPGSTDACRI